MLPSMLPASGHPRSLGRSPKRRWSAARTIAGLLVARRKSLAQHPTLTPSRASVRVRTSKLVPSASRSGMRDVRLRRGCEKLSGERLGVRLGGVSRSKRLADMEP